MNKKFSTLVASLLLATTVGTATAATEKGVASSYPRQTADAIDGKFYQLSDGYNVLAMEQKIDGSFILKFVPYGDAELAKTLWEIRALDNKDEKGLAFQFYNVSTGLPISFDAKLATKWGNSLTATPLSQGVSSWSWVRGVEGDPLLMPTAIESFFSADRDSVMTLMNTANGVAAVKYATKDQASVTGDIQVKPMEASPVYLNAYDLNTMLQTGKEKLHLNFDPNVSDDAKMNEFTGAEGDREFTVKEAVGQNSLSISSVKEAQADADAKESVYNQLGAELTEAIEEFVSLDGQFQDVKIKWNDAKQKHQDALDIRNAEKGAFETADKNVKEYTEKKDAYISQYEAALLLSENDRKDWDKAREIRLAALTARDEAKEVFDIENATYLSLEQASIKAQTDYEVAQGELKVANDVVSGLKVVLENNKTNQEETKKNGSQYVAALEAGELSVSPHYRKVKRADPEAAAALIEYLTPLDWVETNITDAVVSAYLRPYEDIKAKASEARNNARKILNTAKEELEAQTTKKNAAYTAYTTAETAYGNADTNYKNVLEQWEDSSTEANEIWAQVDECQRIIDENVIMRDNTLERWMALEAQIPLLWADVVKYAEEFSEKGTEYGYAQVKVQKLNAKTYTAYCIWQNALAYLNSISDKAENWLSLQYSDGTYLMVDTAYLEGYSSVKHQTFALKKYEAAEVKYPGIETLTARDINGRFNFRFLYYPTVDSLVITADGGNDLPANQERWSDYRPVRDMAGRNYVKLAVLGSGENEHREVTLGAPYDIYTGNAAPQQTLNTRINLSLLMNTPGKDIPAGVYFADVVDPETLEAKSRLMLDLAGNFTKVATAEWDVMNFAHMPAAKWVVKENTIYSGSPAILNQESGRALNDMYYRVLDVTEDGNVIVYLIHYDYQGGRTEETVKLTPVTEVNDYGYIHKGFSANTDSIFTLNYLNVTGGLSVQIGAGNDTILRVAEGEGTQFILENATKDADKYGVNVEKDNTFEKRAYYIRVNDADKLNNNYKYVNVSDVDGTELLVVSDIKTTPNPTKFFLKEVNDVDSVHYFALISADNQYKAGIIDASGLIKAENVMDETTTSAFALNFDKTAYYRKFTSEELGQDGVLNFYRANTTEKAYLYADESLLAVENKGDNVGALSNLTVIPAATEGTIMPQYFIAKDVNVVEGDTIWCNATAAHKHETLADSLACSHTVIVKDTVFGNFLTNFKIDEDLDKANLWENYYSRLGFLKGYITNDTLFINDNDVKYNVPVAKNNHDATKFAFRLVDEGEEQNFLIESESWAKDKAGKEQPFLGGKRPFDEGGWIKIQNTVPVIVKTEYNEAVASGDLFNVDTNYTPTANEEISANAAVSVVATDGAVIVKGAEGKNVIVSTILGKVVANEVLNSDNETIAAPAGIVVVSVDGESFKVAVK